MIIQVYALIIFCLQFYNIMRSLLSETRGDRELLNHFAGLALLAPFYLRVWGFV